MRKMFELAEGSKRNRLRARFVNVLIVIYFAFLFGINLDVNPGLHADEAWSGLHAAQMLSGQTTSLLRGRTWYTGALFPYLLTWPFRVLGISVWSLRCVGVVANLCAICLLAALVYRLYGRLWGMLVLALLLASSVLVAVESRLAWEVTALNPLFAACLLGLAVFFLERGETRRYGSWLPVAAFLSISALGVYSHLIFLSLVLALFVASLLGALRFPGDGVRPLFLLTTLALIDTVGLVSLKVLQHFLSQRFAPALIGVFWLGIAIQAFAFEGLQSRFDEWTRQALARFAQPLHRLMAAGLIVGAAAFAGIHLFAFIQVLSNDVLLRRLYSVKMQWPILGVSYAYALFVLGTYLTVLSHCIRNRLTLRPSEYFLLVLPVPTLLFLPIFTLTNSIRYYLLANLVLIVAVVVAHAHLSNRQARCFLGLLATYALIISATLIPITVNRRHYESVAPMDFVLGYSVEPSHFGPGQETSAHFFSMTPLIDRLRSDGIRRVRTRDDFFIGNPLAFYFLFNKWNADPHRSALIDYDYGRSGGFSYQLLDDH